MKNKGKFSKEKFITAVLIIYLVLLILRPKLFLSASKFFLNSILKIIPALFFVFILMAIINYFITPERIMKFSEKKGFKKWLFMVSAGVLSVGPPFLWYPLLKKLKSHGLSPGLITTYLYSKALVLSFLPLLIFYFSLKYVVVLYFTMIVAAIIQGIIMDRIVK